MICIYSQNNTEYAKNGDAVLIPTVCNLQMTINGTWELRLEHPYDPEERYKYIVEGAVIRADVKCISELTTVQQRFRIYKYEKNLHSVSAIAFPIAMESTYDSPIDNLVISGKTGVQAMAALQAYTNKYTLSTDITTVRSTSLTNTNINNAIASGEGGSFIKVWGGEILYDNLKYSVKSKLGNANADYLIHYGRNLSEISYEKDDSGLTTRIKPISKDGIRLNGTGYVDSPKIYDYPIIHTRYMTAPYNLIEDDDSSNSATAVATRSARTAVRTSTTDESEDAYDAALAAGYQPEYIKTIKTDIVSAVQTMALASITSTSLLNYLLKVISDAMAWLGSLEQPEWDWRGSSETGWWYGNDDSYARNMYVRIGKKWSYFGDNGYWQEPADDSDTWDWYQVNGEDGKKYGNFTKYYAHNTYVYITRDGVLKKYWFDKEGYYDEEKTGDSDWQWNGTGTSEDPYWFGDPNADGDEKKYAHDTWLFIDGVYYFFDSHGYYDGSTKFDDYQWDWVESGENIWFGNPDETFAAVYVTNQWLKINGSWYYFDANGYVVAENTSKANAVSLFTREMAAVKTTVDAQNSALYTVLYNLMTAFANQQYSDGADVPALTITVNMVDLSKTTEYSGFAALEEVKLGDSVEVIDDVHGISLTSRVVGLTYDCIRGFNSEVVIGTPSATVPEILGNAGGTPVAGGFDVSAIESQISAATDAIAVVASDVNRLGTSKQDKLTAGTGISIVNNVISASDGGLQYFHETSQSLYGDNLVPDELTKNPMFVHADVVKARYNGHEPTTTWGDVEFHSKNVNTRAIVCTWERTIITNLWSVSTGEDNGIVIITEDPNVCGLDYIDRTSPYETSTGSYSWGDSTEEQSYYTGHCGFACSHFTYNNKTYYIVLCHHNTYMDWSYEYDSIKEIGTTLTYKTDRGVYSSVAEFGQAIMAMHNQGQTIAGYSGMSQGGLLAFFAGASSNTGADAPIKIYADGTYEGIGGEIDDVLVNNVSKKVGNKAYIDLTDYALASDVPEIEANPQGSATETLTTLDIDGTVYQFQSSGGGGSNLILNACKYSTEEQVVGIWTDGKPLYQRTWIETIPNSSGFASFTNNPVTALDKVVSTEYSVRYKGEQGETPWYTAASVYFDSMETTGFSFYFNGTYLAGNYIEFTARYTKTTDSAGSGGYQAYGFSPIIYSEEEREVGVWINDKPLYCKTVATSGNVPSGATLVYRQALENKDCIYYTKDSDVAGSGDYNTLGIPNVHYDSEEKVVGTWFGETLYEKSYRFTNVPQGSNTYSASITNLNKVVNQFGTFDKTMSTGVWTYNINSQNEINFETRFDMLCRYRNQEQEIYIEVGSVYAPIPEVRFTIQYTKTAS